jgi:hypothetical protein
MTTIPDFSPGCFGSALAFDEAAPVCSVCAFAAQCKPIHELNLKTMRERLGIPAPKITQRAKRDTADQQGMTVPVKTQALIEKIERAGIRVTESFASGLNPFTDMGSNFLKIVGHMLLKSPRPLARNDFAMAFQMKLNWSQGTADSHARMAMQALQYIGAVDEIDGTVTLRR